MRTLSYRNELEDEYENHLNESYETVKICGIHYDAGTTYRTIDPVTFGCEVNVYEGEEYIEVHFEDMTESEREYYCTNERTVMYCRKDENEVDDE